MLASFGPIRELSRGDMERIALNGSFMHVRGGRPVFYQDDPPELAFLILDGAAQRIKYRSDETTLTIGLAGRGEWIGLTEVILKCPYLHDATATESLQLLGFSRIQLMKFLSSTDLAAYLMTVLSRDSYLLHSRLELNRPVDRIADFLLRSVEGPGGKLQLTQDTIAATIGLARETVNRHLKRLEASGAIRISRGKVEILDRQALSDLTEI